MKNGKAINSHYLSISCKTLVKNIIIHYIFFLVELYYLFFIILDIYSKDFNINQVAELNSPFLFLIIMIIQLPMELRFIIYFVIMLLIIAIYFILNFRKVKSNIIVQVLVNLTELIFYRLLSLFLFNYLYILKGIYLYIYCYNSILYIYFVIEFL